MIRFSHLRIGHRLAAGFSVVILLLVCTAGLGYYGLDKLSTGVTRIVDTEYRAAALANRAKDEVSDAVRSMLTTLMMTGDEQIKRELDTVARQMAAHNKTIDELEPLLTDEASQAQLKAIKDARAKFVPAQQAFVKSIAEGDLEGAPLKFQFSVRAAQVRYLAALDKLVELRNEKMTADGASYTAMARGMVPVLAGLALAAIVCSAVTAFLITRGIVLPLQGAVGLARKVAAGDLTSKISVRRHDETGDLLRALSEMNDSLKGIVSRVHEGTDSIASASSQIATGNIDLSSRTERQVASLEKTLSAMKSLSDAVHLNAQNAKQGNQLAKEASKVAEEGGAVVAQVVSTMGSIDASSKKIVDIISVIDGIAFQTNILALNAAVEAARAGDQGRGFAVVAGEVRSLAQRSASAAKEIKTLIVDSVEKVAEGSALVSKAGSTMHDVVTSVQWMTAIMGEITQASTEQSADISRVTQVVREMEEGTQQNAALVEQAAAAADSLRAQAQGLDQVVSVFQTQAA